MHTEIEDLFDLSGKVALITGGARDLGNDAASILAAAGCRIALTSRNAITADLAAKKIAETYGVEAIGLSLYQTNFDSVAETVEAIRSHFGQIDILINNAGGTPPSTASKLLDRDPKDIAAMIALNLTGTLYVCREAGRVMAERKQGKIINFGSIAGIVGRDRRIYEQNGLLGQPVDYAAAKAGIIGATRDLAAYLSPLGINVNTISPGGFERPDMKPGFVSDYSDRTPLGRMGRDGIDLKGAILFLASPASDYITGHNLVVDGGFSIWR